MKRSLLQRGVSLYMGVYTRVARRIRMLRVAIAILTPLAVMLAQQPSSQTQSGGNSSTANQNPSPTSSGNSAARQPKEIGAYLSGRVLMEDGSAPPPDVVVRRMCGGRTTAEAYTDVKGYFILHLSGNDRFMGDASSPGGFARSDYQLAPGFTGRGNGNPMPNTNSDCELRAVVAGYRSEALSLAGQHPSDSGDIGSIILHRQNGSAGYTTSATTALAPKQARRFYQKGLAAIRRHGPDEAQKDFLRAVEIFPRFAEAWLQLGQIYDQRVHPSEARAAYNQAIHADPGYAKPYERIAVLDLKEHLWEQAADASGKVLGLDPEFTRGYYVNAVANLELHRLPAAERSARKALLQNDSEAEYVLGMILAQKGEMAEAVSSLRAYLAAGGPAESEASARKMLARIDPDSRW